MLQILSQNKEWSMSTTRSSRFEEQLDGKETLDAADDPVIKLLERKMRLACLDKNSLSEVTCKNQVENIKPLMFLPKQRKKEGIVSERNRNYRSDRKHHQEQKVCVLCVYLWWGGGGGGQEERTG